MGYIPPPDIHALFGFPRSPSQSTPNSEGFHFSVLSGRVSLGCRDTAGQSISDLYGKAALGPRISFPPGKHGLWRGKIAAAQTRQSCLVRTLKLLQSSSIPRTESFPDLPRTGGRGSFGRLITFLSGALSFFPSPYRLETGERSIANNVEPGTPLEAPASNSGIPVACQCCHWRRGAQHIVEFLNLPRSPVDVDSSVGNTGRLSKGPFLMLAAW